MWPPDSKGFFPCFSLRLSGLGLLLWASSAGCAMEELATLNALHDWTWWSDFSPHALKTSATHTYTHVSCWDVNTTTDPLLPVDQEIWRIYLYCLTFNYGNHPGCMTLCWRWVCVVAVTPSNDIIKTTSWCVGTVFWLSYVGSDGVLTWWPRQLTTVLIDNDWKRMVVTPSGGNNNAIRTVGDYLATSPGNKMGVCPTWSLLCPVPGGSTPITGTEWGRIQARILWLPTSTTASRLNCNTHQSRPMPLWQSNETSSGLTITCSIS